MYLKRKITQFVSLGILSFIVISFAPGLVGNAAAAPKPLGSSNGKLQLAVNLTGIDASTTSKYTVTATQTNGSATNKYNFAYVSKGTFNGKYLSDNILYIDNGCTSALGNDALAIYQITISATYLSNSGTVTVNTCGYNNSYVYPVDVPVTQNAQFGGIKGTFTWTSNDGSVKPYPASSSATLSGPDGKTYVVTLNDSGTITGPVQILNKLPIGSYSIKIDYNPTNPVDGPQLREITKSFTVINGLVTDLSSTAANQITPPATDAENLANLKCQASIFNPLTWLVCPMIAAANKAVNVFDGQISCLLQVDLNDVFGSSANNSKNNPYAAACNPSGDASANGKSSSDAYYAAWNTFRTFALALMVIAGLVMVISQAAGFELLDAYTVRKVLPRLLIAGIGITLSWQIMQFLIEITNAVGFGIRDIIYFPFKSFGSTTISGTGTSLIAAAFVGGGFAFLGLAGLATFALTALLGVLVAFITLVLRKLIIIFLLMLAPLAIACYILPNTQKFWKMWWDTLSKALLVFPIIAAMIAVGHVFAVTSYGSGNGGPTSQIIAFIAYFLPYFMIPTAVKMSGGAVGAIAGMVNNRAQGGFGALRKRRSAITQERTHNAVARAKGGDIVRGRFAKSKTGSLINRKTQGVTTGYKGRFGMGDRGDAATDAFRDDATTQFMKTSAFANNVNNDNVLRAAAVGRNRAEAVTNLQSVFGYSQADAEKHAAQAEATIGYSQAARQAAAMQLVSTGTGYETMKQMSQTLALASNGNANTRSRLAGFANAETKTRGRPELAPGFSELNGLVTAEATAYATGSAASRPTPQQYHAFTVKAVRGQDPIALLRGKPAEVVTLTNTLGAHLKDTWADANDSSLSLTDRQTAMREVFQTAAQIKSLDNNKGYASPEIQQHVNNMLKSTESERGGLQSMIRSSAQAQEEWEQISPRPQNPNDPNLP